VAKGGKDSTLTIAMFKAAYPGIMNALDYQHAKVWFGHHRPAGRPTARSTRGSRAMDQKARENALRVD